jgi:predicted  nucleic acid-binding Zn-ribbon protein
MTNPLQQLEQKLQSHQKRIVDLEAKYAQLLEDLKTLREKMAFANPTSLVNKPTEQAHQYRPAFDRWPGSQR